MSAFPSDLEVARSVTPRPIVDVAHDLGLHDDEIELYGPIKAKVEPGRHHPPGGRAATRQVRRGHGDHPDAARRGQDDDDGRAGPGPQPDRPAGGRRDPPAEPRPGVRDQGRRGRRRLQPGHPDGGLQPPPDRRQPRDRRCPQPGCGVPRQPPAPQEPARHRRDVDRLAARRRHQRSRHPQGHHRPGRQGERTGPRGRVADHGRVGGHGYPRARVRPARPARAARPDRARDHDEPAIPSRPRTSRSPAR